MYLHDRALFEVSLACANSYWKWYNSWETLHLSAYIIFGSCFAKWSVSSTLWYFFQQVKSLISNTCVIYMATTAEATSNNRMWAEKYQTCMVTLFPHLHELLLQQLMIITARILRMGEGNIFSLFTLAGGGGGVPHPGLDGWGGTPSQVWGRGVPHLSSGGGWYLIQLWMVGGYPISGLRGTPSQVWGDPGQVLMVWGEVPGVPPG